MLALSLLALAAPLVSAIQFTEPFANSTLKKGQTYSVKWSSVDTDPTTFSIYLVNFVDWPPFYTQVASDVQTSEGVHQVTVPCDVSTSWGFQFNAINGTNVYVIHAQTPRFYVRDGACSGSAPVPPPHGASSTCKPVTVTETETETVASTITVAASCSLSPSTSGLATASTANTAATTKAEPKPTSTASTSGSLTAKPQPTGKPGSGDNGEDVDTDTACSTEDSVPTSTSSHASVQPAVTAPPVVNNAHAGSSGTGTTSTVYSTVYRDLSEVHEECEQSCAAH